MKNILLALCLSLSLNVYANDCQDLAKCVESVSKLTGKKYLYDGKLKGDLKTSSNLQFTAENADILFSSILSLNNLSRVPTLDKETYKIVESRDIRYETLPTLSASLTETPVMPKSEDYYVMTYLMTNYKDGQGREMANSLRPFMSRWGRIIETVGSNMIIVQETASKMPMMLDQFRRGDRVFTADDIKLRKERMEKEERREQMEMMSGRNAEKRGPKKDEPKPQLLKK